MAPAIDLFVIGFGRPDLLWQQHRLLHKYLADDFFLTLVDNTRSPYDEQMRMMCRDTGINYLRSPSYEGLHPDALNCAVDHALASESEYWATLDHDIFPRRAVTLIDKIDPAGFFGIGQTHPATLRRYLWPGICCFSRAWLNGRVPNFNGIRDDLKRNDGDCGSMLYELFTDADWDKMVRPQHGYEFIRPEDQHGLQSWGFEFFDSWIHFTNASGWKEIPNPEERERLLREMVAAL